jgi:GNAT superfamily N-acetyltransferase
MKFVDLELARRLECAAHSEPAAPASEVPSPGGRARMQIAGGIAVFAGVNSPVTQAEGLGLNGPVSDEEFAQLEEFFRSRGSAVVIEVCPLADPSFAEALGKRGYRIVEFTNVLVRELLGPFEKFPRFAPDVTARLANPKEARLFAETVGWGFADHFPLTEELVASVQSFLSGVGKFPYLAFFDRVAAAGGTLTIRDGLAGLLGASTLPKFRNRGVQSALISVRLVAARDAGCNLAMSVTQPSSGSQRNLERQGFRVVYTRAKFIREWA